MLVAINNIKYKKNHVFFRLTSIHFAQYLPINFRWVSKENSFLDLAIYIRVVMDDCCIRGEKLNVVSRNAELPMPSTPPYSEIWHFSAVEYVTSQIGSSLMGVIVTEQTCSSQT